MKNRDIHGQAAMESMATYIWAILALVLALAALFWLGAFTNANSARSTYCLLQPFTCEIVASGNNKVTVQIYQNTATDYTHFTLSLLRIRVNGKNGCSNGLANLAPNDVHLEDNLRSAFSGDCPGLDSNVNGYFEADLVAKYQKNGLLQTTLGKTKAYVEPG